MTEVRVHAAFKVKDEETFLKEAAKIVEATQVDCFFESSILNSLIIVQLDETTTTVTSGHLVFAINSPQAEEGCIHYQLYKEAGQPGSYAMIETWATQVISLPETTMQCKSG